MAAGGQNMVAGMSGCYHAQWPIPLYYFSKKVTRNQVRARNAS